MTALFIAAYVFAGLLTAIVVRYLQIDMPRHDRESSLMLSVFWPFVFLMAFIINLSDWMERAVDWTVRRMRRL